MTPTDSRGNKVFEIGQRVRTTNGYHTGKVWKIQGTHVQIVTDDYKVKTFMRSNLDVVEEQGVNMSAIELHKEHFPPKMTGPEFVNKVFSLVEDLIPLSESKLYNHHKKTTFDLMSLNEPVKIRRASIMRNGYKVTINVCGNCNVEIRDLRRFCPSCGQRLEKEKV